MPAMTDVPGIVGGAENIVPGNTATGFTAGTIAPTTGQFKNSKAIAAFITCEAQTVHFSLDGVAPTAAAGSNIGHSLIAGASFWIIGVRAVALFKCIDRVSGSAGTVKATFYFEHAANQLESGPTT